MIALLASLLPNLLLNGLHAYLQATTTAEETKRQIVATTVAGVVSLRQQQAAVVQTGMAHKAFWIPWLIAATSASVWYAWGMADSSWPGHLPHIAALPPQLLALTDQIWGNLFLSGSIAVGGSSIAAAIKAILK